MALAAGSLLAAGIGAQETTAPSAPPAQAPAHNNVKKAIRWKTFRYTCEGGTTVTVALADTLAKVTYDNHQYLMKQTKSADGNRYSDGQLVWWGKGDGGFLQEDRPDWNGKMVTKDCKMDKSGEESFGGTITGTVSYRERMALPPDAVIHVQLLDMSVWEMPPPVVAEEKFPLGNRQVPVAFELKVDPAKIDFKHSYALRARIVVGYDIRFLSELPTGVKLRGNAAPHVDLMLMQMEK